jgi:hypothetical protein
MVLKFRHVGTGIYIKLSEMVGVKFCHMVMLKNKKLRTGEVVKVSDTYHT